MNYMKWLYPGMKLKRWFLLFTAGVLVSSIGLAAVFNYKYMGILEEEIFKFVYRLTGQYAYTVSIALGVVVLVVGLFTMYFATRQIIRSIISVLVPEGPDKLVEIIYEKRKLGRGPSVVVVGGGTGLSVLLRGLKQYTHNVTAVVTVADDGGSSGRIRKELGIIPPGDLRNCLVALADTEPLMEKLFQHRFGGKGELKGHSFGNLFIAAMCEIIGDFEQAIKESSKVLAVRGQVLPSTLHAIRLVAEFEDGSVVEGESCIPKAGKTIKRVYIEPQNAEPVTDAIEALLEADAIVLGPGSLYTSVLPNLLVKGIADAIKKSQAIKVYVCNVMTQPGETTGYTASRHVQTILDHVGPGVIDYCIVNVQSVPEPLGEKYAEQKAYPVEADIEAIEKMGIKVARERLISEADVVRHDSQKLSRAIVKLILKLKSSTERMKILDYYLLGEKLKQR
jgi:uncharacterized cofD-like protein